MPFKKGDKNINRNGRPALGKSWSDVLRKIGEEEIAVGADKMTKMEAVCRKLWAEASKGQPWAINSIIDRIDGKAIQKVEQIGDGLPEINFTVLANKEKKEAASDGKSDL